MKTLKAIPEGYAKVFEADMKNNKKLSIWLNAVAIGVFVVLAVPMHFIVPVTGLFSMEQGLGIYFLRFVVMIAAYVAYIVLHELTHGAAMKIYGGEKLNFGFNGLFAWCGCKESFFPKKSFIVITLAPLVVWGVVLSAVCTLCGVFCPEWFWVVYFLQLGNITGAVGDVYVSARLSRLHRNTVVNDDGLGMRAYAPEE